MDNAPAPDGHQNDSLLGNLLSQYAGRHYRYDSRGNLVEKRVNGSLTRLEWDSHSRLSRLIAPDGQRTDYHYDPLGRRIAKISQGQATLYGWDGDVLAFETRDEEAVHYLFEPDSFVPLAQVHTDAIRGVKVPAWSQHHPYDPDKDPLRQPAPEPEAPKAVYYYHTDHLGTPQALTDEQGLLALEMDYQAWGQAREVIADAAGKAGIRNPFRFQGQYHDDESGLHYNRHRYYDPEIGRFISRDPIGLKGGYNLFAYAPNTIEWVDPFGLTKLRETDPKARSLSNVQTRCWYLREESKIGYQIDCTKPIKQQARQAARLRNEARIRARLLMADREKAIALHQSDPNLTFKELMALKENKKGLTGKDAYQDIVDSASKSRQSVNKALLEGVDCDKVLEGI
ncbi:RHS repeat domain-containing protein [Chromobacterium violaceum]|uniref:RHS repeat domain-containing protein n=1 Tax=Chromobacterium violaceum TaxID=536 RepID=UPI0002FA88AA|nr:RHS repeat-associated core domain-containing protein [Chromobacterium violaceum]